jgi:hypothetical protein
MGLRDRLRRLLNDADEELISIPQPDGGPPARFHPDDFEAAFLSNLARLQGEDQGEEHPLTTAANSSPDPRWRDSFFSSSAIVADADLEDLSE